VGLRSDFRRTNPEQSRKHDLVAATQPATAREARQRLGLTAEQLARKLGLTASYVRLVERNGCRCFKTAERLTSVLRCDMKLFLPSASPKRRPGSSPRHTGR